LAGIRYNTPVRCHQMDATQKDSIFNFLNEICKSDDVIIWSDLDEIPNPEVIKELKDFYSSGKIYNFAQEYCMCYLNMVEKTGSFNSQTRDFDYENYPKWIGTKMFDFSFLSKYTMTEMRRELPKEENVRINPGGWHWTYVGSEEVSVEDRVITKINSAAHQEYNKDSVKKRITELLELNMDPLGRNQGRYEIVQMDESYPNYILNNIEKFSYLIKNVSN